MLYMITSELSVPKSDVLLLSRDVVDIVLHGLASAAMLDTGVKDPTFARSTFCDMFPKAEYQASLFTESKSEGRPEHFPYSSKKKPAYANGDQTAREEKEDEDTKNSVPDPCHESADFITKMIFDRLQTFATERVDSLIPLALQLKGMSFVTPELENYTQDGSVFHESNQVELHVNIPKRSTTKTALSQELTEPTFASYREKFGAIIHLSQASLEEYVDIIANATLKFIKNDLDLEIQKMHLYPNNSLF